MVIVFIVHSLCNSCSELSNTVKSAPDGLSNIPKFMYTHFYASSRLSTMPLSANNDAIKFDRGRQWALKS
jgi:hypothetical protein